MPINLAAARISRRLQILRANEGALDPTGQTHTHGNERRRDAAFALIFSIT